MQKAYMMALCDLAGSDRNVLSLLADSGTGFDELFRRYYPEQLLDFGIAEEAMTAAAAGLAMCGKIPFVYTAGAFLAYHSYEYIRDDICFHNLNVKLVGMGTGLSWSTLGITHHTTEDLGALRSLPNLAVITPGCPSETGEAVRAAYQYKGPVYIRIGMNNEPELYEDAQLRDSFEIGKNRTVRVGRDACVFSCGSILSEVCKAAVLLDEQGIRIQVVNVHTLKPFDEQSVLNAAGKFRYLFTVEEHNVIGGIGSAAAEVLAGHLSALSPDKRFYRIGLDDRFAVGYGTLEEVRQANELNAVSIADTIKRILCSGGGLII